MKKVLFCLCGLLICLALTARDDFGVVLSADVSKKIAKGLNINLEEEYRSRSDFSEVERFSHALDLSYKPFTFLKTGAAYNLINYNHIKKGWEVRHRYYFYATGSFEVKRITFSLRERYQSTKRVGVIETATRANPKLLLRSRFKVDYNIRKSRFTPYASIELFNTLNNPQQNKMEQWRSMAGTEYKLNKRNLLDFYYRYTHTTDSEERSIHQIGIAYSFKF